MKTWLITGCSTGLGRSLAKAVLQKGDNVLVTARDTKKLEEFEKDFPRTALIVRLDVTDLPSVTEAVRAVWDSATLRGILQKRAWRLRL
ncbi:SDR family NAD(P)-dependent oxidoreductase [Otoolea muris]|uniref:SDR family NAD(P)-dependent oxidoreductase n=1 Tax=Otoolea muris TaxID=2941515 RepID=UPI00203ED808|nr:SDR family NAD(P)-dependent oxidoreductase [Otoolea muris]